jgi:membrane fusion protein (multidrug efflux system)
MRLALLLSSLVWGSGIIYAPAYAQGAPSQGVPAPLGGEYIVRVLVAPKLETTLASPMLGRIRTLNASLGSSFKKGERLVVFYCEERNARVAMGQAEVAAARENHEAKLRLQGLQSAAEIEVALAAAALEKARAQLALYRTQAAECIIRAPFTGRVAKLYVKEQQSVTAGQSLIDVISEGTPKLRLNVPSKWLTWLTMGRVFTVTIDENYHTYKATVTAINARVDAASQSVELEAEVNNPGPELLPGMSGTALFDTH